MKRADQCLAGWMNVQHGKNFDVANFLRYYRCDKCQTCMMILLIELLSIHTTFSGVEYVSRLRRCQTVWIFYVIRWSWNLIFKYVKYIMNIPLFFFSSLTFPCIDVLFSFKKKYKKTCYPVQEGSMNEQNCISWRSVVLLVIQADLLCSALCSSSVSAVSAIRCWRDCCICIEVFVYLHDFFPSSSCCPSWRLVYSLVHIRLFMYTGRYKY